MIIISGIDYVIIAGDYNIYIAQLLYFLHFYAINIVNIFSKTKRRKNILQREYILKQKRRESIFN